MKIVRKTKNNKEMHSNLILKGQLLYSSIWPILRQILSPLNKGGKRKDYDTSNSNSTVCSRLTRSKETEIEHYVLCLS